MNSARITEELIAAFSKVRKPDVFYVDPIALRRNHQQEMVEYEGLNWDTAIIEDIVECWDVDTALTPCAVHYLTPRWLICVMKAPETGFANLLITLERELIHSKHNGSNIELFSEEQRSCILNVLTYLNGRKDSSVLDLAKEFSLVPVL